MLLQTQTLKQNKRRKNNSKTVCNKWSNEVEHMVRNGNKHPKLSLNFYEWLLACVCARRIVWNFQSNWNPISKRISVAKRAQCLHGMPSRYYKIIIFGLWVFGADLSSIDARHTPFTQVHIIRFYILFCLR